MKKYVIYGFIIFLFSVLIGFFIGKFVNIGKSTDISLENITGNTINLGTSEKAIVETSTTEEKVSPNANLVIEKNYRDCKHIVKTTSEIPTEMVDLTKYEIEKAYPEWILKDFSKNKVSLYKVLDGICNEHFIITDESGQIVIYRLDEDYNKTLYERTDIDTEYLTSEDLEKLEQGIYVYGVGELNSVLESFE